MEKPLLKITFLNGKNVVSKYVFHKGGIVFYSVGYSPSLCGIAFYKIKSIDFIQPNEI